MRSCSLPCCSVITGHILPLEEHVSVVTDMRSHRWATLDSQRPTTRLSRSRTTRPCCQRLAYSLRAAAYAPLPPRGTVILGPAGRRGADEAGASLSWEVSKQSSKGPRRRGERQ